MHVIFLVQIEQLCTAPHNDLEAPQSHSENPFKKDVSFEKMNDEAHPLDTYGPGAVCLFIRSNKMLEYGGPGLCAKLVQAWAATY
jgi:hypothetical protein